MKTIDRRHLNAVVLVALFSVTALLGALWPTETARFTEAESIALANYSACDFACCAPICIDINVIPYDVGSGNPIGWRLIPGSGLPSVPIVFEIDYLRSVAHPTAPDPMVTIRGMVEPDGQVTFIDAPWHSVGGCDRVDAVGNPYPMLEAFEVDPVNSGNQPGDPCFKHTYWLSYVAHTIYLQNIPSPVKYCFREIRARIRDDAPAAFTRHDLSGWEWETDDCTTPAAFETVVDLPWHSLHISEIDDTECIPVGGTANSNHVIETLEVRGYFASE